MPSEHNKPERQRVKRDSALPALEKMQRISHDRMVRSRDTVNRVREAARREEPAPRDHHHD